MGGIEKMSAQFFTVRTLILWNRFEFNVASATRNGDDDFEGVEFTREDDGSITVRDTETGLARGGDTRAETLSQLAEVLVLRKGGGEPVTDNDFEELGLDLDEFENRELPDFMQ